MRKENTLLAFLAATVFLIIFSPSLGWKARMFLAPLPGQNDDSKKIILENESLKTELAKERLMKSESLRAAGDMLQAFVYSNYPLNFKNRLLVNAGKSRGVKAGQPVFVSPASSTAILIGKVSEVFKDDSIVETVFDPNFQLSVKVGDSGDSSLLKGGNAPRLTLMPKEAKINDGDAVYSAGQGYRFGLPVGLVRNIALSPDQFFQEADLETAYNSNDFHTVFIDTNYDPKNARQ